MRSARFENEAGHCKNQMGRPNGGPRMENLKISWFVQHKEPSNAIIVVVVVVVFTILYFFYLTFQGSADSLPLLSWQFAIIQVGSTKVIDPVSTICKVITDQLCSCFLNGKEEIGQPLTLV